MRAGPQLGVDAYASVAAFGHVSLQAASRDTHFAHFCEGRTGPSLHPPHPWPTLCSHSVNHSVLFLEHLTNSNNNCIQYVRLFGRCPWLRGEDAVLGLWASGVWARSPTASAAALGHKNMQHIFATLVLHATEV